MGNGCGWSIGDGCGWCMGVGFRMCVCSLYRVPTYDELVADSDQPSDSEVSL